MSAAVDHSIDPRIDELILLAEHTSRGPEPSAFAYDSSPASSNHN